MTKFQGKMLPGFLLRIQTGRRVRQKVVEPTLDKDVQLSTEVYILTIEKSYEGLFA